MDNLLVKRLLDLVRPFWAKLILAMLCMVMVAAITALMAFLVKPVLDDIFFKKNLAKLTILPPLVIVLYVLKGFFSYGHTYLMSFVGQKIVAELRVMLYTHIQSLAQRFFDLTPTGILMSRITNDVNLIQGAVSSAVTGILKDAFTVVGLVVVIFYRDWQLALMAMLVFPIAVIPIVKFGRKLRKISTQSQVTMGSITMLLHETISGSRIVKAFNMEPYEVGRFSRENDRLFRLYMRDVSVKAMSSPVMEFLGGVGIALIIWYGGYQVINGTSTPGTFFSFMTALIMLYEPVKRLSSMNNTIQQGLAGGVRVFEILDTPSEICDKPGAQALPILKKGIRFENVSFRYDRQWVLKDISFEVKAGEMIAIVGVSGSGKTTLVHLLPRFYEVTEGAIRIDGTDIREATLKSLRDQIGMVTQQIILFNDTIRSNISYGTRKATEEDLELVAGAAYALDFIKKLPDKFETVIGEQGVLLSGGERQRLAIARALLKDPPILILDEATSSLDSESEFEVQKALDNLMKGRTTLVIAHRLSTIRSADRILVVENGRIVEEGTHDALMEKKGEYFRLHEMQFMSTMFNSVDEPES
jgi:subfamily B ATP-binding cassette protein MsbA